MDNDILSLEQPRKVRRVASAGPSDFSSVVTIITGIKPDYKVFMLHSHVIRGSSGLLVTKMDALMDDDNPIRLPDVDTKDFAVYAKFLYTGLRYTKEGNKTGLTWSLQLYQIATYLEAIDFQDAIVDSILEIMLDRRTGTGLVCLGPEIIKFIYSISDEGSPLRKLTKDSYLQSTSSGRFSRDRLKRCSVEFQLDPLVAAAPFVTSAAKAADMHDYLDLSESCRYHNHVPLGAPCYKTKTLSASDKPELGTDVVTRPSTPSVRMSSQMGLESEQKESHGKDLPMAGK